MKPLINIISDIDVKLYLRILLISILAYGSKIFFTSYSTDDYSRYMLHESWYALAGESGRWGQSSLNDFIFSDQYHILPYFNSILSLAVICLSFYIYLNSFGFIGTKLKSICILLLTISPFIGHNLAFNTNVPVSFSILSSAIAFRFIVSEQFRLAMMGSMITIISVSIYQASLQLTVLFLISNLVVKSSKMEDLRETFQLLRISFSYAFYCIIGYTLYYISTEIILYATDIDSSSRYEMTKSIDLEHALFTLLRIDNLPPLSFIIEYKYASKIQNLLIILTGILCLSTLFNRGKLLISLFKLLTFAVLAFVASVTLNLQEYFFMGSPLRAYYALDVVFVTLFIISFTSNKLTRNIGTILCVLLILARTLYISVFFDGLNRQANMDMNIANDIVSQIQFHESLTGKKIEKLLILGKQRFTPEGFDWHQQAFNADWSKYKIIDIFSYRDFEYITSDEKIKPYIENIKLSQATYENYPSGLGFVYINDTAVIIMDKSLIK